MGKKMKIIIDYIKNNRALQVALLLTVALAVYLGTRENDQWLKYEDKGEFKQVRIPDAIYKKHDCILFERWKYNNDVSASCPWEKEPALFKIGGTQFSVREIFVKEDLGVIEFEYPSMLPINETNSENSIGLSFYETPQEIVLRNVKDVGFDKKLRKHKYQIQGEDVVSFIYTNDDLANLKQYILCENEYCLDIFKYQDIYIHYSAREKLISQQLQDDIRQLVRSWETI